MDHRDHQIFIAQSQRLEDAQRRIAWLEAALQEIRKVNHERMGAVNVRIDAVIDRAIGTEYGSVA